MTFFHPGKSEEKMVVRPLRVQGDQGGEDQERVVPQQRRRNFLYSGTNLMKSFLLV